MRQGWAPRPMDGRGIDKMRQLAKRLDKLAASMVCTLNLKTLSSSTILFLCYIGPGQGRSASADCKLRAHHWRIGEYYYECQFCYQ